MSKNRKNKIVSWIAVLFLAGFVITLGAGAAWTMNNLEYLTARESTIAVIGVMSLVALLVNPAFRIKSRKTAR